jgi:hypothetical protein
MAERIALDYYFELTDIRPEFHFYDDSSKRIGARALRVSGDQAHIFLGLSLVYDEKRQNVRGWESAIIGTLAHEWAHAFQYYKNLDEKLFVWETHADYLSGWYVGAKLSGGLIQLDPQVFASALFLKGSTLGYFNENAYGSPQQRVDAMRMGLKFGFENTRQNGRPNIIAAAERGYTEVKQLVGSEHEQGRQR